MRSRSISPLLILSLTLAAIACRAAAIQPASPSPSLEPSPSATGPSPSGNLNIAVLDSTGNVLLTNRDNTRRAVTTDASDTNRYQHLTWSPDGSHLAFVQTYLFGDAIHIYDLAAGDSKTVFSSEEEFVIYLYWAPDSRHLSFLTGGGLPADLELNWVNVETGSPTTIAQAQPLYWAFAPDSDQVALHLNGGTQESSINLLDPSAVNSESQSLGLGPGFFQAPSWHPDGLSLFAATSDSFGHSQILRTVPNQEPQIVYSGYGRIAFTPSPDGQFLAIIENLDPFRSIFAGPLTVIDLESGASVFTAPAADNFAFFWSPDASHLLYFSFDSQPAEEQQGNFNSSRLARPRPQSVSISVHVASFPANASNILAADFQPTDEFGQMLLFFDQYAHSHSLWSSDSSTVLLAGSNSSGQSGIWLYAVEAATIPQQLVDGLFAVFSPVPFP
ncbi:MAG: hypothetical protein EPO32_13075 [Anaerolineae bacterium]|nr:MAG: hypothetical protein EPO32_13075 [Anaerolineae bacterium]